MAKKGEIPPVVFLVMGEKPPIMKRRLFRLIIISMIPSLAASGV
jgi:hypothetical protein